MVLAIFNPFCCCTAGVLAVDDSVVANAVAHSCCQSQSTELPVGSESGNEHDPEQCPHQALKDYKVSLDKDHSAAPHASSLLPALLAVFDLVVYEPVAPASLAIDLATLSHAPPTSLAQVYCVYRI